jgi:hypothetical protein
VTAGLVSTVSMRLRDAGRFQCFNETLGPDRGLNGITDTFMMLREPLQKLRASLIPIKWEP